MKTTPIVSPHYVAITMLDDTVEAVMILKERLAKEGYEAVIFQSSGGPAIEELAGAGMLAGAVDFIACEPYDEKADVIQLPRLVVPLFTRSSEYDRGKAEGARSIAHWLNQ